MPVSSRSNQSASTQWPGRTSLRMILCFFFFQAEDGIRDLTVTGVQTCALPISALVYFVMLPFVLWFSLNQQITGGGAISVELMPKVSDYMSLVTTLLLAFGLCLDRKSVV